jgi:phenylalanyl-tRNA synthetase beta subunit
MTDKQNNPWFQSPEIQLQAVEKGILEANLGFTPSNDGSVVRINLPPMTEDRRKEMVKLVGQMAEQARIGIRQVREDILKAVNQVLGTQLTQDQMERALTRLDLSHTVAGETFTVTPRFERLDLMIPEDLIEEIGRIVGYDTVPTVQLPQLPTPAIVNANFARIEYARAHMAEYGYTEVYTSVFADKGERQVLNKVGGERPYLRANLTDGLKDALERAVRMKDLLGIKTVKLIEIGTVWTKSGEEVRCATAEEKGEVKEFSMADLPDAPADFAFPATTLDRYKVFSKYPFIVRDIALWAPQDTEPVEVLEIIRNNAGPLLIRSELFDTFVKGEKTSLAFRLVFQSYEKTLTDEEVNAIMNTVTAALRSSGFEIR